MVYRFESFSEDRGIVILQSLEVVHLSNITNRFYQSPKLKIVCVNYAPFRKSDHIYYYVATIELIPMIIHQSFIKHEKRMCLIFFVYVGTHVRVACVAT